MALRADPIFFRSLTKGKGSRRTAFALENPHEAAFEACVVAVRECPEWLHLERVGRDGEARPLVPSPEALELPPEARRGHPAWLIVGPRRRLQLVAAVNTDHRFFPRAAPDLPTGARALENEGARVELELHDGQRLEIPVALAEVVLGRPEFEGIFALDFGTTNSCWAWKRRRSDPEGLSRPPTCSEEVPSVIYFRDLRLREQPKVLVGEKARLAILAHPERVWASCESIKRLLGSDRKVTVLDARGRTATYTPEEVVSFALRELLERAELDHLDGARVTRVVATYPTLFSPRQRRALQDALLLALRAKEEALVPAECLATGERSPQVQARCDQLVELRLDEANAATFRYITGPLLEACHRFNREQVRDVLSFDMGGGTIDVSFLRVAVRRDLARRATSIETRLLGVSGEPGYGGDNVSLELLRLLRAKLVLEGARELLARSQAAAQVGRASEGLDIFDRILEGSGLPAADGYRGEAPGDPWDEDDLLAAPPLEQRLELARMLVEHGDRLLEATAQGQEQPGAGEEGDPSLEHLRRLLREWAAREGRPYDPGLAQRLLDAMERFLPTRFARYADQDPMLEQRAKVFFMDLWREANDRLKPLLVARAGEEGGEARASVQEPLERLARWVGVDPKVWNDRVSVSLAELEHMVAPRVRAAVTKARDLYLGAREAEEAPSPTARLRSEAERPLLSTSAQRRPAELPQLTVLVTGNSSILPVVRRAFAEVLVGVEHELVWDERTRKTSVVQGAVEECLLRREFGGEGGGIHYRSTDFLDRLPFSVGLWSRFVGFRPLFPRGAREGERVVVSAEECELLGRDLEDLPLYADYHDGAPVRYLGFFDLRGDPGRPATQSELGVIAPAATDDAGRQVYRVQLRLLKDWGLELLDPESGRARRLSLDKRRLDPRDDPFSGTH